MTGGTDKKEIFGMVGNLPFAHRRRVAVFSGSFDPLHKGHVAIAKYLLNAKILLDREESVRQGNIALAEYIRRSQSVSERYQKRLERYQMELSKEREDDDFIVNTPPDKPVEVNAIEEVLFIPALCSPFKDATNATPGQRLEMLRRVCVAPENAGFSYSDIELRRAGKSYSFDTMTTLSRVYTDLDLYFVLGMDNLAGLEKWYRANEFVQSFNFIIYPRPGVERPSFIALSKAFGPKNANKLLDSILIGNDVPLSKISSSEIRSLLAQGKDASEMLPPESLAYIQENRIYTEQ